MGDEAEVDAEKKKDRESKKTVTVCPTSATTDRPRLESVLSLMWMLWMRGTDVTTLSDVGG